jgi:hypothetical protein
MRYVSNEWRRLREQAVGVGVEDGVELVESERGFEQLEEGGFAGEEGSVGAEEKAARGDGGAVDGIFAFDELSEAAVAFDGGDVEGDLGFADQSGEGVAEEWAGGVDELNFGVWELLQ